MKSREILELLRKIPKGKVVSYKELARKAGTSPRAVGQILKKNPFPHKYPCYRVVKSDGRIGGYFGSSEKNAKKKISLLRYDGIKITSMKIERKYFHRFCK